MAQHKTAAARSEEQAAWLPRVRPYLMYSGNVVMKLHCHM
jgi:hypothetical protein